MRNNSEARTSPHPTTLAPSCVHPMNSVLASTITSAFLKLDQRLDITTAHLINSDADPISACKGALQISKHIASKGFPEKSIPNQDRYIPDAVPLSLVSPWLQSFARRSVAPLPTDSLTGLLLTFLVQCPQAYLDLVPPLLDQRFETQHPVESAELSIKQALALDIYARWSVLMFLAEEDSWWIENLPVITLEGMMNRYGNDFVRRLWKIKAGEEAWWPAGYLEGDQEASLKTYD